MKSEEMLDEVEMNEAMINRADVLDNAAYRYFLELLELDGAEHEKVEEIFPWDVSILRDLLDYAVSLLGNRNLYICNPSVMEEYGRIYRCTLSECGCKECHCQDRFMEKERVLARNTEAMKINGIELVESDQGGVDIREKATGCQLRIQVTQAESKGSEE